MSWCEEWVLQSPVTPELVAQIEALLGAALPGRFDRQVMLRDGRVVVRVRVSPSALRELGRILDGPLSFFDGWDWENDLDPLQPGSAYTLRVELQNQIPETFDWPGEQALPILSVRSDDAANRAAWPVAFVLAARLAHELGAVESETYPRLPN